MISATLADSVRAKTSPHYAATLSITKQYLLKQSVNSYTAAKPLFLYCYYKDLVITNLMSAFRHTFDIKGVGHLYLYPCRFYTLEALLKEDNYRPKGMHLKILTGSRKGCQKHIIKKISLLLRSRGGGFQRWDFDL